MNNDYFAEGRKKGGSVKSYYEKTMLKLFSMDLKEERK